MRGWPLHVSHALAPGVRMAWFRVKEFFVPLIEAIFPLHVYDVCLCHLSLEGIRHQSSPPSGAIALSSLLVPVVCNCCRAERPLHGATLPCQRCNARNTLLCMPDTRAQQPRSTVIFFAHAFVHTKNVARACVACIRTPGSRTCLLRCG